MSAFQNVLLLSDYFFAQVSNGETSGSQFMIVYLPGHDYNCITNYVYDHLFLYFRFWRLPKFLNIIARKYLKLGNQFGQAA